jgi:Domain of Unknown Function (DUF1206)
VDGQAAAEHVDEGARRSRVLEGAVRVGLLAYGVVHLLVAWIAVRLVLGSGSGSATGRGALAQLAGDSLGTVTLLAMAACFVALAVWQSIAAVVGYRQLVGWRRHLMRFGALCRVVVYGYLAFAAAQLVLSNRSSSGRSTQSTTAKVMAVPAGRFIVGGAGLTLAGIGAGLVVFGLRKSFLGQLDRQARTATRRTPIVVLGQVGYVVKGAAFVVIGVLLGWAAWTRDPQKSGGLDGSLRELLGGTLGPPAVIVAGVGIGCFGLYLFARSRHLDRDTLTS